MTATPEAEEMRYLSRVTANYKGLQGLVMVPVALWLLASAVVAVYAPAHLAIPLGLVPVFLAMALITRHYHRRFGRVRSGELGYQMAAAALGLAVFVVLGVFIRLLSGPGGGGVPIWLTGVQVALMLAVMYSAGPLLRRRPADLLLSRHWLVVAATLLAVALVPVGLLTGGGHPLNAEEYWLPAMMAAIGVPFLVGGLRDHRRLVRALSPARGAQEEA